MNATLWTFDAAQWGGFAFGAFIAALAYCTAYLTGTQRFSLGNVDFSGWQSGRMRRLMLTTTSLCALAAFSFSSAVFVALQVLTQGPAPEELESRYFAKEELKPAARAALASQPIVAATVRVLAYDGASNARVFVNHNRVFESSVHCRFKHQCKPAGAASGVTGMACQQFRCETNAGNEVERPVPVLRTATPSAISGPVARDCNPLKTMNDIRNCEPCTPPSDCNFRQVNWQRGIATNEHSLPHDEDIKKHLRPGNNVVEVAAENSGVGSCRLVVELLITTADGKPQKHVFSIIGTRKQLPKELGPRYGVEPSREPFTTCDRQRMKLMLMGA